MTGAQNIFVQQPHFTDYQTHLTAVFFQTLLSRCQLLAMV